MIHKYINLGNKAEALEFLEDFKNKKYVPFYVRITNSNILVLNTIIGNKVFKKDEVYVRSSTLHDIMQQPGGKGEHNYHGLTPNDVYNALSRIHLSKNVEPTEDNKYIVITDVKVSDEVSLIVIIKAKGYIFKLDRKKVVIIITIYPKK